MKRRGFLKRIGAALGFGAAASVLPMLPEQKPKCIRGKDVEIELVTEDGERLKLGPYVEPTRIRKVEVTIVQDFKRDVDPDRVMTSTFRALEKLSRKKVG